MFFSLFPSFTSLLVQAKIWRMFMALGMAFHNLPTPRPPSPSFRRRITTSTSSTPGDINLLFYTPTDYKRFHGGDKVLGGGYPVVVNFHGGGFIMGQASDDSRWADAVVKQVNAVVVCVEYRLAPECPFPTAVEDGVDAILYLLQNWQELGINPHKIATSGFSAGGNLAFTVPLKLQEIQDVQSNKHLHHNYEEERVEPVELNNNVMKSLYSPVNFNPIVAIASWYPVTDFATPRAPSIRPDMEIPEFLVELFGASYLPQPQLDLSDPCLSPGLAPVQMLRGLPNDIILYTCEWDNLCPEAERLRDRLVDEAGKQVMYRMVAGVHHGWDKSPNPLKRDSSIDDIYGEVCAALRRAFDAASHEF